MFVKEVPDSSNLLRHKRTYIGDKPYECDVLCEEIFLIKLFKWNTKEPVMLEENLMNVIFERKHFHDE